MLYPDLSRLALACPTGMMQAAAPTAPTAPAPAPAPAAGPPNVVTIWNGLTPLQQQTVIELLELDKQRAANEMSAATTMEKTLVFKATRNKEALLPLELQNRQWKQQPWIVVLSAPQYRHLFTAAEEPGFYGHQIGEDEPNQAKDYGRHLVYNPWGGWEHPRYYNSRPTGATPEELRAAESKAWADAYYAGSTPAEQDAAARRAREELERMDELLPPDGVPPAPPPPEQQPELNVWNGLNGAQQNIVLRILAQKKKLREYRAGYRGHDEAGIPDSVANAVQALAAQLPASMNTPEKFAMTDWELALEGQPEYDYVFGIGGYKGD
jgi:predicted Fe-S protein YdhL (DUF1289 family)